MLFSIFVYGFIVFIMTYNAKKILDRSFVPTTFLQYITDRNILIPILVFCIFAAIRWGVGVDCNSYMSSYYDFDEFKIREKEEYGYLFLVNFFHILGASHIPLFFSLALLQIGFIYYSFKDKPEILLFFPLMLFLSGDYWMWMNGMRQVIAFCIFVYVTYLLSKREYIWAAAYLLFASLFHHSVLFLIPVCVLFAVPKIYITNRYLQLGIVFGCYLLMGSAINGLLGSYIERNLTLEDNYIEDQLHLIDTVFDKTFGFRSYLLLLANCIAIYFSPKLQQYFNSPHFNILYNLYFIGVCLGLLFYGNHGLERISLYFTCAVPIILSCAAYYFYKHSRLSIWLYVMLFLLAARTGYDFYASSQIVNEAVLYKTIFDNPTPTSVFSF